MVTTSRAAFAALIAVVGLERLAEVRVAKRNAAWSFAHGGTEFGAGHYPVMVALHTLFLVGAVAEVVLLRRVFALAIGGPALVVVVLAQGLRWWCIRTLGPRWNTRVIVVPGLPRVTGGPYRLLDHPNYVAVVAEGAALPLVHGAWITAAVFSVANAFLLRHRIRVENAALATLPKEAE